MKKVIVMISVLAVALLALTGCGGKKEKLKLFLPGEYLGENVISDFEKEFNCKVIVENFDSNEAMYTKLQAGDKYDVLIPSDYTIERLLAEDYLQKLDKDAITNIGNLADQVKNLSFDPNNDYSIPYFWGTVGIVYNKKTVPLSDLEAEGFAIFKDAKYKDRVYMYDSARDGFMIALKSLGYSCNTEDEAQIEEAYNWLIEMNKTTKPIYVTDEVIDNMKAARKDLAIVYSGDAVDIICDNPDMGYYTPECGTNVWYDSMVIPKNAENPKLANEFINYIHRPEIYAEFLDTFNFPAFYGKGIRYALLARADFSSRLMLMARLAVTDYFDRDHISTGLQRIDHSSKTDLELQLRWRF